MNFIVTCRRIKYGSSTARKYVFTATVYTAVHFTYSPVCMNVIHVCEDVYIQRYEDIHTNILTNFLHSVYIYYIVILNLILIIYCLCNIKLNYKIKKNIIKKIKLKIVQLVACDIYIYMCVCVCVFIFTHETLTTSNM
jgi:hypothetical protein